MTLPPLQNIAESVDFASNEIGNLADGVQRREDKVHHLRHKLKTYTYYETTGSRKMEDYSKVMLDQSRNLHSQVTHFKKGHSELNDEVDNGIEEAETCLQNHLKALQAIESKKTNLEDGVHELTMKVSTFEKEKEILDNQTQKAEDILAAYTTRPFCEAETKRQLYTENQFSIQRALESEYSVIAELRQRMHSESHIAQLRNEAFHKEMAKFKAEPLDHAPLEALQTHVARLHRADARMSAFYEEIRSTAITTRAAIKSKREELRKVKTNVAQLDSSLQVIRADYCPEYNRKLIARIGDARQRKESLVSKLSRAKVKYETNRIQEKKARAELGKYLHATTIMDTETLDLARQLDEVRLLEIQHIKSQVAIEERVVDLVSDLNELDRQLARAKEDASELQKPRLAPRMPQIKQPPQHIPLLRKINKVRTTVTQLEAVYKHKFAEHFHQEQELNRLRLAARQENFQLDQLKADQARAADEKAIHGNRTQFVSMDNLREMIIEKRHQNEATLARIRERSEKLHRVEVVHGISPEGVFVLQDHERVVDRRRQRKLRVFEAEQRTQQMQDLIDVENHIYQQIQDEIQYWSVQTNINVGLQMKQWALALQAICGELRNFG